jgi:hypothetical protein
MRVLRRFLARLANFVAGRRGDQRLREEMEEHLAMQMEENLRSGMSPAEARRQAALKSGAAEAVKENYPDEQGLPFIENLLQDVRYAWRQMRKSPSFTLLTALILTLGIGVNTAIFSLVDHILLEPLPFSQPDHLYSVWAHSDAQGNARIAASGPDFLDYQDQSRSFSLIAEYVKLGPATVIRSCFIAQVSPRPSLTCSVSARIWAALTPRRSTPIFGTQRP